MLSDVEIAQQCKPKHIRDVAAELGIAEEDLVFYGKDKAKVPLSVLEGLANKPDGKLILVTAITPTPAGEGKTTTAIGLADALHKMGKSTCLALREPSLGPCFGIKGSRPCCSFRPYCPSRPYPSITGPSPRFDCHQNASSQQGLRQDGLQLVPQRGRFLLGRIELLEKLPGIAVVVFHGVRVLEVEVVGAGLHVVGRDLPRDFRFLAPPALRPAPPFDAGIEVLEANRLGHRVGLLAVRDAVFVESDGFGRLALLEEQQVRADRGVGFEHAVGQADDGVQVALLVKPTSSRI